MYLKKIKIKTTDYEIGANVLKKGFEFRCSDINLFVGEQGTGKSTLLKMLAGRSESLEIELAEHVKKNGVKSFYFDTEKNNPRLRDPQEYTTPGGKDVGIGFMGAVASRFRSHGELMREMVVETLFAPETRDCVIMIDEPESGMSINSQFRLIEGIGVAIKKNCQIFMATHCYPLIEQFDVISLDHWKTMKGTAYIKGVCGSKTVC